MLHNRWFSIILTGVILAGMLGLACVSRGSALSAVTTLGRISPEFQISTIQTPTDADRHLPVAAYNSEHKQFLVVWHNLWPGGSRDIYGQRVDASGKKVGPWFSISSGPGNRFLPAVVYNSIEGLYLVVFMQDVSAAYDGSKYDIKGQFVGWDGVLLGTAFTIQTWDNSSFWSPRLVFNPVWNEYMVVWGGINTSTGLSSGIGMKKLNHYGNEIYGTVLSTDGYPTSPDIVWNPDLNNYLVVWESLNASGKLNIMGQLLDPAGNPLPSVGNPTTPPFTFGIYGSNTNHTLSARVAYSKGIYGVVFEYEYASNDHDIYMAYVFPDGSLISPVLLDTTDNHDTHTAIAGSPHSTGQEFIILFQRATVNGAQVWMRPITNYMASINREVCNYIFWDCTYPAVARGGAGYLMLYTLDSVGDSSVTQHVYGRMFWQFASYLPAIAK